MFHSTKIALQKWFLTISLIGNAKKSLSRHQLARDLDLNQKMAWYIMTRIRAEMAKKGGALLQGIIEADEIYIGGKPRKPNKREGFVPSKRGYVQRNMLSSGLSNAAGRVLHNSLRK